MGRLQETVRHEIDRFIRSDGNPGTLYHHADQGGASTGIGRLAEFQDEGFPKTPIGRIRKNILRDDVLKNWDKS